MGTRRERERARVASIARTWCLDELEALIEALALMSIRDLICRAGGCPRLQAWAGLFHGPRASHDGPMASGGLFMCPEPLTFGVEGPFSPPDTAVSTLQSK
jgi:hypothetical protein